MKRREALVGLCAFAVGVSAGALLTQAATQRLKPRWSDLTPEIDQFTIRDSARGFEHDGKLWLSGGYMVGNVPRRDLLSSRDGVHWTMINPETPFAAYSPVTSHQGRMVATYPTVMVSDDGVIWTEVPSQGDMPPLGSERPIISFNGELILLTEKGTYVWSRSIWRRVENPFANRIAFSAGVHDGAVFVLAGASLTPNPRTESGYDATSLNDVWVSSDPTDAASWTRLLAFAPWRERMWPGVVSHEGWLYAIGGWVNQIAKNVADVWRTRDGVVWEELRMDMHPSARHAPTMFSRDGRILLVAGNTNTGTSVQNDIWSLTA